MGIQTIEEFLKVAYGNAMVNVTKDDDMAATDSGDNNVVFGAYAFSQYNEIANTLGAIPKFGRTNSGWRVDSAMAGGATAGEGGVDEGGAVPASDHNTVAEITALPKEIMHTFTATTKEIGVVGKDDVFGNPDIWKKKLATRHAKRMNEMLFVNVTTLISASPAYRLESLDRVVSSYAEVTNCGDITAGDSDPYAGQLDRDAAASYADAYVNHNSNTDRAFTLALARTLKTQIVKQGGKPTMFVTGPETLQHIENQVETQMRYAPVSYTKGLVRTSANGLQTEGIDAGTTVGILYGTPIIEDADTTSDGAPRLFCLDTSTADNGIPKLGLGMTKAPMFLSADNLLLLGYLKEKYAYFTQAELLCHVFRHQAKLRDISA